MCFGPEKVPTCFRHPRGVWSREWMEETGQRWEPGLPASGTARLTTSASRWEGSLR